MPINAGFEYARAEENILMLRVINKD